MRFFIPLVIILIMVSSYVVDKSSSIQNSSLEKVRFSASTPSYLTQEHFLNLGWIRTYGYSSNYLNYPKKKRSDQVRIGIFSGSFAVCGGRSKNKSYDYPTQLQERFHEANLKNIEIINFGVGSYGFFQISKFHEWVGKDYDLDYVFFGLDQVPKFRDLSFFQSQHDPLHGRYLVKNGKLNMLEVKGKTREDALRLATGLFPPWQYWVYEREHPPSLVKALTPKSMWNRKNPFYLQSFNSDKEEVLAIFTEGLKEIAKSSRHVIAMVNERDYAFLQKSLAGSGVDLYVAPPFPGGFIYYDERTYDHLGPLGNRQLAEELFSYLTNGPAPSSKTLKLSPTRSTFSEASLIQPLHQYTNLAVHIGSYEIGRLSNVRALSLNVMNFIKERNISSLLTLSQHHKEYYRLIALPFMLHDSHPLNISFIHNGKKESFPIGTVHTPNSLTGDIEAHPGVSLSLNTLHKADIFVYINENTTRISGDTLPKTAEDISLSINNTIFAKGLKIEYSQEKTKLYFKLANAHMLYLKSKNKHFYEKNPFEGTLSGSMELVLTKKNRSTTRLPFLDYEFLPLEEKFKNQPYTKLRISEKHFR